MKTNKPKAKTKIGENSNIKIVKNKIIYENIDIDSDIKKLLLAKGIMKGVSLIAEINKKTGRSVITISNHIKHLVTTEQIIRIESKDFGKYGIIADGRAPFLASLQTQEAKMYVDKIFELLESKNADDIKLAGRELRHYHLDYSGKYFLNGEQLNTLTNILENSIDENKFKEFKDDEFRTILLMIIFNEISKNKKEPKDKDPFLESLGKLLDLYKTEEYYSKPINQNPMPYIIRILGIYRNKKLIERLKHDVSSCTNQVLLTIVPYFCNENTAKTIEDNRIELLQFEQKLQKGGKIEALEFIDGIRREATRILSEMKT